MLQTTDGKTFVYGVFSADGCECRELEGLFESEEAAKEFLQQIKQDPYIYGHPQFATVEVLQMGVRFDPLGRIEIK